MAALSRQPTMDGTEVTEEYIDGLKATGAVNLGDKYGIDLQDYTKLPDIQCVLKLKLLCQNKTRESAIVSLTASGQADDTRKRALLEIFEDTLTFSNSIAKMDDPVVEQMQKIYPNFCQLIEKHQSITKHSKAPVLVLGETGSGKSSFINLLLGEDILPCSLLSNTHVICEIRYGQDDQCYAVMHPVKDHPVEAKKICEDGDRAAFKRELADCIQAIDKAGRPVYGRAEIYLPCDVLKSGLVIVDSPGIGDTKEMYNMVLDYLIEACTFIYVINSTSAGGVQTRLQDLLRHVYKKALEEQKEYRPESAIFICNKWDQVPFKERQEVWADTKRKIFDCWPKTEKGKEPHLFHFSTKEASFIQREGGLSPQFHKVLHEINQLVPIGQEILVLRGFRFLDGFVDKCLHCLGTSLCQLQFEAQQRKEKQQSALKRFNLLKHNIDSFFDSQKKLLKTKTEILAGKLKDFLTEPSNIEKVCRFADCEVPRTTDWKEAAIAIRAHVYTEIMKMIQEWEEEHGEFRSIGEEISKQLDSQFPVFDAQIYQAEQELSRTGYTPPPDEFIDEEEMDPLLPQSIRRKMERLNFGMRVAVGIGLAPVFVVGLAVRLPVFGFRSLKRAIEKYRLESKFREGSDLRKASEEYAKSTVLAITDKLKLEKIIEEDIQPVYKYIKSQKRRMKEQISLDMELIQQLKEEERSDVDIERLYRPLQAKFLIQKGRLKHFLLLHVPAGRERIKWLNEVRFNNVEISDTVICSGLAADIFHGKSRIPERTNGLEQVALRKCKQQVKPQNIESYLHVESAYCNIKHENIARCVAVTVVQGIPYQVLEPLGCSLRQHLQTAAMQEKLQSNKLNTILDIMKKVVSGLKFLHDKTLVHFDLSMDTVAVDMHGCIKVTNIGDERRINLTPDFTTAITLKDYVYCNPDFVLNNNRRVYRTSDDMYGVGIMMWELWSEEAIVAPDTQFDCEDKEKLPEVFKQFLEHHARPQRTECFDLAPMHQNVHFVDNWWTCLTACLNRKMTSDEWLSNWKDFTTYPSLTLVDTYEHF